MILFPDVIKQNYLNTTKTDIVSEFYNTRTVLLFGNIDKETADAIMLQLLHLNHVSKDPIKLLIDSSGGEINSGLLIYDILSSLDTEVDLFCTGQAASIAAWILASGQKGHRFILRHSYTMIHEPRSLSKVGGFVTDIENMSKKDLITKEKLNDILAYHTGRTVKEINKLTKLDYYMDAEESVKFGICDKVVDSIQI